MSQLVDTQNLGFFGFLGPCRQIFRPATVDTGHKDVHKTPVQPVTGNGEITKVIINLTSYQLIEGYESNMTRKKYWLQTGLQPLSRCLTWGAPTDERLSSGHSRNHCCVEVWPHAFVGRLGLTWLCNPSDVRQNEMLVQHYIGYIDLSSEWVIHELKHAYALTQDARFYSTYQLVVYTSSFCTIRHSTRHEFIEWKFSPGCIQEPKGFWSL